MFFSIESHSLVFVLFHILWPEDISINIISLIEGNLFGTYYGCGCAKRHVAQGHYNTTTTEVLNKSITIMRCKATSLPGRILKQTHARCVYAELLRTLNIFLRKICIIKFMINLSTQEASWLCWEKLCLYTQIIYTWVSKAGSVHAELPKPTLT